MGELVSLSDARQRRTDASRLRAAAAAHPSAVVTGRVTVGAGTRSHTVDPYTGRTCCGLDPTGCHPAYSWHVPCARCP